MDTIERIISSITKKNDERDVYLEEYYNSYDEETNNYYIEEPKEIDQLGGEINTLLKFHIDILPVDFVIESLNKLGYSINIVYDDNGHYAISYAGMQSIPEETEEDERDDVIIYHFVEKEEWHNSIREALVYYINLDDEKDEIQENN